MIIAFPISARVAARLVVARGTHLAATYAARPRLAMSWSVDASGRPVAQWREEDDLPAAKDDPLSHRLGRPRRSHRPAAVGRFSRDAHGQRSWFRRSPRAELDAAFGSGVQRVIFGSSHRDFPEARCRKIGQNIV